MMKRILACLLTAACLLTSFAFAEGIYMKVVNVKEAVNLREGPGTDTKALGQVPVDTVVTDCATDGVKQKDGYTWYQVNYNGTVGYIRSDKLEEVPAPAEQSAETVAEPAAEQPAEPAAEQPAEPAAEQPAEPAAEQPAEPAVEQPAEPAAEQPAEPAVEQPAEPAAEQPAEAVAEQPAETVAEQPAEPAAEPTPEATKKPRKKKKATAAPAEATQVAEGEPLAVDSEAQQPEATKKPRNVLSKVKDAPVASYSDVSGYSDDSVILDQVVNGVRVIGRQIYRENYEYLMVVGLDESGNELWKKETKTDSITELMQTDAFIAGTEKSPLVLIYNACRGLVAINPANGKGKWQIYKRDLDLGGSISHAVGANGVTYIGGYYGPDPVAISRKGKVLWKANSGVDATWLYRMDLTDAGIACAYGKISDEEYGTIVYDLKGNVVNVIKE